LPMAGDFKSHISLIFRGRKTQTPSSMRLVSYFPFWQRSSVLNFP
jgi:hypothetical protein